MQNRARLAALLTALPLLLWLDGWLRLPAVGRARASGPPREIQSSLGAVAGDLIERARTLAANPEVARSLEGGGIAVRRQALFSGARKAMDGAAAGTWIVLADSRGNAHAWWGDAPAQIPEIQPSGTLEVRWSAMRLELVHWRVVGSGTFAGVICA